MDVLGLSYIALGGAIGYLGVVLLNGLFMWWNGDFK